MSVHTYGVSKALTSISWIQDKTVCIKVQLYSCTNVRLYLQLFYASTGLTTVDTEGPALTCQALEVVGWTVLGFATRALGEPEPLSRETQIPPPRDVRCLSVFFCLISGPPWLVGLPIILGFHCGPVFNMYSIWRSTLYRVEVCGPPQMPPPDPAESIK
jgi:hypothetical protein